MWYARDKALLETQGKVVVARKMMKLSTCDRRLRFMYIIMYTHTWSQPAATVCDQFQHMSVIEDRQVLRLS
jgi:hypothetical protein